MERKTSPKIEAHFGWNSAGWFPGPRLRLFQDLKAISKEIPCRVFLFIYPVLGFIWVQENSPSSLTTKPKSLN